MQSFVHVYVSVKLIMPHVTVAFKIHELHRNVGDIVELLGRKFCVDFELVTTHSGTMK